MARQLFDIIESGMTGWSRWFRILRLHQHVCCTCLSTHNLQQRIVREREIEERWQVAARATANARRAWSSEKRKAFAAFLAVKK